MQSFCRDTDTRISRENHTRQATIITWLGFGYTHLLLAEEVVARRVVQLEGLAIDHMVLIIEHSRTTITCTNGDYP